MNTFQFGTWGGSNARVLDLEKWIAGFLIGFGLTLGAMFATVAAFALFC